MIPPSIVVFAEMALTFDLPYPPNAGRAPKTEPNILILPRATNSRFDEMGRSYMDPNDFDAVVDSKNPNMAHINPDAQSFLIKCRLDRDRGL